MKIKTQLMGIALAILLLSVVNGAFTLLHTGNIDEHDRGVGPPARECHVELRRPDAVAGLRAVRVPANGLRPADAELKLRDRVARRVAGLERKRAAASHDRERDARSGPGTAAHE